MVESNKGILEYIYKKLLNKNINISDKNFKLLNKLFKFLYTLDYQNSINSHYKLQFINFLLTELATNDLDKILDVNSISTFFSQIIKRSTNVNKSQFINIVYLYNKYIYM